MCRAAQNDAIENYITQKVDGIILVAIDVNGVKPAITAAKTAGIPVVAIDAQIPDGDNVAFIGVDNTKAGEDIGKFYADYVKSEMGGTAKIGIVGALNSFIQNQRLDGFKKAVTDSGVDGHLPRHGRRPERSGDRVERFREFDDSQSGHDDAICDRRAGVARRSFGRDQPGPHRRRQGVRLGSDQAGDSRASTMAG